jgi:hypothetical protein
MFLFIVGYISSSILILHTHFNTWNGTSFKPLPYLCILESTVTLIIFRGYNWRISKHDPSPSADLTAKKLKALFETEHTRLGHSINKLRDKLRHQEKVASKLLWLFFTVIVCNLIVVRNWGTMVEAFQGKDYFRISLALATVPYTIQQVRNAMGGGGAQNESSTYQLTETLPGSLRFVVVRDDDDCPLSYLLPLPGDSAGD